MTAVALASALLAGAIAATDHTASKAAAPPIRPKPASAPAQGQTQFQALATRYYMVIPGSSRPAS